MGRTVLEYEGQNLGVARWGGWISELGPLSPRPENRLRPHWLIITAIGYCRWRGNSHVRFNYAKGHSSSGSKESGTLKYTKYGVYCYDARVYQPNLLKMIALDTG